MSDPQPGFALFMKRATRRHVLSREEEVALMKRVEAGDHKARELMIEHNVRLVISMAKRYVSAAITLEDLVQEGVMGLHKAVDKFEWRKGFKFSTYATWWIRHALQRHVQNTSHTIRVPAYILENRRKIKRYLNQHPDAEADEISLALDIPLGQVETAFDGPEANRSLDNVMSESGTPFHEIIEDPDAVNPADNLDLGRNDDLRRAMETLSDLERQVLELRFGFNGPVRSRDDVAVALGVQPHAVQRAQRAALAKLRREMSFQDVVADADPNDLSRVLASMKDNSEQTDPTCVRKDPDA